MNSYQYFAYSGKASGSGSTNYTSPTLDEAIERFIRHHDWCWQEKKCLIFFHEAGKKRRLVAHKRAHQTYFCRLV